MANSSRGSNKPNDALDQPPPSFANVAPPHYQADHSFTLQAVMELQKSNGQLTEAVNSLRTVILKQEAKLDKLDENLSTIKQKLYAAGVVLAIIVTIGGFLINKTWDLLAQQLIPQQPVKTLSQPKP